jgi:hypothetical protein
MQSLNVASTLKTEQNTNFNEVEVLRELSY